MATSCLLFIPSKPILTHCKTIYTSEGVISWCRKSSPAYFINIAIWTYFFRIISIFQDLFNMYYKCDTLPFFFCLSFALFPPLLSSVCCAVRVDLWYKSQGPLLTAFLYLYCRDSAHSDRKSDPGPCGHEQKERERERERNTRRGWVRREERKRHCNKVSDWLMKLRRKNDQKERGTWLNTTSSSR